MLIDNLVKKLTTAKFICVVIYAKNKPMSIGMLFLLLVY